MPPMRVGSNRIRRGEIAISKEHANVVRVIVGETSGASESTTVSVIEANIDDSSPQLIGYAMERMFRSRRAFDALVIPAQMKGSPRFFDPGHRRTRKM